MTIELQMDESISSHSHQRPPVPGMEKDFTMDNSSKQIKTSSIALLGCGSGRTAAQQRTATDCGSEQFAMAGHSGRRVSSSDRSKSGSTSSDHRTSQFNGLRESTLLRASSSDRSGSDSTPPCLRWAESLSFLLEDSDGVRLFKQYLDTEHNTALLDFWFACSGLQMVSENDQHKVENLVKLIFKKYVKANQLNLKSDIRKRVVDKLKGGSAHIDCNIYEEAKQHVEDILKSDMYPLFLKSDVYLQYVQAYSDSPKTSSSSVSSTRPMSAAALPTLPEEEELRQEDIVGSGPIALSLTSNNLAATIGSRSNNKEGLFAVPSSRVPNPYHVYCSYVTTSAQDSASDMQSMSSDALTDDTLSQADSAIEGRDAKKWRRHQMRKNASINRHVDTHQAFIPRTERLPKDRNLAETNPERFAVQLTERLRLVLEEEEKMERLQEKFRHIEGAVDEESMMEVSTINNRRLNTTAVMAGGNQSSLQLSLVASMLVVAADGGTGADEQGDEDEAQSILDNHMSRIWQSSGQTPCRSPGGRHSPPAISAAAASFVPGWSPGRARRSLLTLPPATPSFPATVASPADTSRSRRRETVHGSTMRPQAVDDVIGAGHGQRMAGGGSSSSSHRARHQQGSVDSAYSSQANEPAAVWHRSLPHTSLAPAGLGSGSNRMRDGESTYSTADSGISDNPPTSDPASDKVVKWMMSNEVATDRQTTQYSTDASERSSSCRKSTKSSSASKGSALAMSSRKDVDPWSIAGGQAVDGGRSHRQLLNASTHSALVNTPGVSHTYHDLSLPISDRSARHGSKTESSSHHHRDVTMPPPSQHQQLRHVTRVLPPPPPLDLSANRSSSVERLLGNNVKSPAVPPVTGESSTIVGYYFCGEEIPYRTTLPGKTITLSQFKQLLVTKKGSFRYFFKMLSNEFETGVVHTEITDDDAILPLYDGKIICKVEKVD